MCVMSGAVRTDLGILSGATRTLGALLANIHGTRAHEAGNNARCSGLGENYLHIYGLPYFYRHRSHALPAATNLRRARINLCAR